MKKAVAIFLLLVFAISAHAQTKDIDQLKKEAKAFKSKYYVVGYDKFKDLSIVVFSPGVIGSTGSLLYGGRIVSFSVDLYFKGRKLTGTPNDFLWKFSEYSQNVENGLDSTIYVLADDERIELKADLNESRISSDILGSLETSDAVLFPLTRQMLEKLASAKKLELQMSGKSYTLKPSQQQPFKDILKISTIH